MFLLGFAALVQSFILPGLILQRVFKFRSNWMVQLFFSVPFSLLFTHYLVFFLTACGWYLRPVVLSLFAVQCIALFALIKLENRRKSSESPFKFLDPSVFENFRKFQFPNLVLFAFCLFTLQVVVREFKNFYLQVPGIFETWDAAVSWNYWATQWYGNRVPLDTWLYPQLLPIVYSLTYKFIGTSKVQFFAHASQGILVLLGVGSLLAATLLHRSLTAIFVIATYFYIKFLKVYVGHLTYSGYVDASLSCYPLAMLICLIILKRRNSKKDEDFIKYVLAAILASAALTKHNALGLLALLCATFSYWTGRRETRFVLLTLGLVAPWYLSRAYLVATGVEKPTVVMLFNYTDPQLVKTIVSTLTYVWTHSPEVLLFAPLSLFLPKVRLVTVFLTIPIFICWSYLLSYASRNLALGLGPMAISVAGGIWFFTLRIKILVEVLGNLNRRVLVVSTRLLLVGLVLFAAWYASRNFSSDKLLAIQDFKERGIGNREINKEIYTEFSRHPNQYPIYTDYPYLTLVPDISKRTKYLDCENTNCVSGISFADKAYVLLWPGSKSSLVKFVFEREQSRTTTVVFEKDQFKMVLLSGK